MAGWFCDRLLARFSLIRRATPALCWGWRSTRTELPSPLPHTPLPHQAPGPTKPQPPPTGANSGYANNTGTTTPANPPNPNAHQVAPIAGPKAPSTCSELACPQTIRAPKPGPSIPNRSVVSQTDCSLKTRHISSKAIVAAHQCTAQTILFASNLINAFASVKYGPDMEVNTATPWIQTFACTATLPVAWTLADYLPRLIRHL